VIWAFLMNWGQRGFSSLFAVGLAAILGPEPAGVMALALAFIMLVQALVEGGLTSALVQRKDLDAEHLNTVFWTTLALSIGLGLVAIVLAPAWARVNGTPELGAIIRGLAPTLPLSALTIVQEADLRRRMDFRSLAIRATAGVVVGGVAGIAAALAGLGVWSLVVQTLGQSVVSVALLWRLGSFRPSRSYSMSHLKDVLGFSVWVFAGSMGSYADRYSHTVIMGLFFSPLSVGLYTVMVRVRDLVFMMTSRALATVALPEFSRHQEDGPRLKRRYIHCIALASMLTIPPLVLMTVVGEPLAMSLGPKWTPYAHTAGIALALLCLGGLTAPVSMFTSSLLQATGRPGASAAFTWVVSGLTIAGYLVAGAILKDRPLHEQVVGIAASRLVVVVVFTAPIQLYMAHMACGVGGRETIRALGPALLASAAGAGVAMAARTAIGIGSYPLVGQIGGLSVIYALGAAPVAWASEPMVRRATAAVWDRLFPTRCGDGGSEKMKDIAPPG